MHDPSLPFSLVGALENGMPPCMCYLSHMDVNVNGIVGEIRFELDSN